MERECSFGVAASVKTGAFRFLREDFEAIAGDAAVLPLPKFLFDKVIGSIGLSGIDDVPADRVGNQICDLKP